jgi:hypothetical protein
MYRKGLYQGEGREVVETAIHRASPSVMRASRGVRRSNCKQIWLRVHYPSEGNIRALRGKSRIGVRLVFNHARDDNFTL